MECRIPSRSELAQVRFVTVPRVDDIPGGPCFLSPSPTIRFYCKKLKRDIRDDRRTVIIMNTCPKVSSNIKRHSDLLTRHGLITELARSEKNVPSLIKPALHKQLICPHIRCGICPH